VPYVTPRRFASRSRDSTIQYWEIHVHPSLLIARTARRSEHERGNDVFDTGTAHRTKSAHRPHNHRWTYTSRILSGKYTHTLYSTDHEFTGEVDVSALTPRLVRTEEPGDTYTLHHSMIHSVTAHGEAVTLIVRGPAVKDRFVVTDRITGKAWWQYGAATETTETAEAKRMSDNQLRTRTARLRASGIFGIPEALR